MRLFVYLLVVVHAIYAFHGIRTLPMHISSTIGITHGLKQQMNLQNNDNIDGVDIHSHAIHVMVNGLPGPMALETAKACIDRGLHIIPVGFTGPNSVDEITIEGQVKKQTVQLYKGPGLCDDAIERLERVKAEYKDVVVIDYTHPDAALNNIHTYIRTNCDFVMGTTGIEQSSILDAFQLGSNYAVIAPNMAKQIVAVQYALLAMVDRFPGSFENYQLHVRTCVHIIHIYIYTYYNVWTRISYYL